MKVTYRVDTNRPMIWNRIEGGATYAIYHPSLDRWGSGGAEWVYDDISRPTCLLEMALSGVPPK